MKFIINYQKLRIRHWDYTVILEIIGEVKWLQALGFEEGKEMKVKQQKNKLTITLAERK